MHDITMEHLILSTCNIETGNDLTDEEIKEALKNKPFLESYLADMIYENELCKDFDPDWYVQDIKDIKEILNTLK